MALTSDERKELLLSIEENQLVDKLYDSLGMKILLDKVEDMINEYDRLDSVKDMNDLAFKKGQLDILKWIAGYQGLIRQTLEQQVEIAENEVRIAKMARGISND
jgi:hypothetical protein